MSPELEEAAECVRSALHSSGLRVTLGGEPTYVPFDPQGDEWSVTALGPTKLPCALRFAEALIDNELPNAMRVLTSGKLYPGETNPRWILKLIAPRDGRPLLTVCPPETARVPTAATLARFRRGLAAALKLDRPRWHELADPQRPDGAAYVLPLDYASRRWVTAKWVWPRGVEPMLIHADGPCGLRLPLHLLEGEDVPKRALVVDLREDQVHVFIPPLVQKTFLQLLRHLSALCRDLRLHALRLEGYVPHDEADVWVVVGLSADPGVLEANIPPCASWQEYARWIERLDRCASLAGLRSWKSTHAIASAGTGGGSHLLFGGASLDDNPFFTRPSLVSALCRYFQHHPSLAFLFTGRFVGPASQAPRVDETLMPADDIEMAYSALDALSDGEDCRELICDTLRHLHSDAGGSAHRSEICFDKFWCISEPGGCSGLIEFRAIEAFPEPRWNGAVALLWLAILARVNASRFREPIRRFGPRLHDRFLLPSQTRADFESVLTDLRAHGFDLPHGPFDELWEWRYPILLTHEEGSERLVIRRALEPWPLLSETPIVGGATSRFVDSSIERIEITAMGRLPTHRRLFVNEREIVLTPAGTGLHGAGLRYRASALHPSLHPAQPVQTPLRLVLTDETGHRVVRAWELSGSHHRAVPAPLPDRFSPGPPVSKPFDDAMTYDLRLSQS